MHSEVARARKSDTSQQKRKLGPSLTFLSGFIVCNVESLEATAADQHTAPVGRGTPFNLKSTDCGGQWYRTVLLRSLMILLSAISQPTLCTITPPHRQAALRAVAYVPRRSLGHLDGAAGVHVHPVICHPWPPFFIAKVQMPFSVCGASLTFVLKVADTTA